MTLQELKEKADFYLSQEHSRDLEVIIPDNGGGMGSISHVRVNSAHKGIDWNSGYFILYPEPPLVRQPLDFEEQMRKDQKAHQFGIKLHEKQIARKLKFILKENTSYTAIHTALTFLINELNA